MGQELVPYDRSRAVAQVHYLSVLGMTEREIAAELVMPKSTVHDMLREELTATSSLSREAARALALDRLALVRKGNTVDLSHNDPSIRMKARLVALKLEDQQAKLEGTNSPDRVKVESDDDGDYGDTKRQLQEYLAAKKVTDPDPEWERA